MAPCLTHENIQGQFGTYLYWLIYDMVRRREIPAMKPKKRTVKMWKAIH